MRKVFLFILAMVLSFLPGFVGVLFTPHGMSNVWYNALNKSVLTPDGWVFGVAWAVLYALLGIALFIIMNNQRRGVRKAGAYALFGIQMVLNALWCVLFFGVAMPVAAFVCIGALIFVTMIMIGAFGRISRGAAWLVVPYLAWLIFAAYLNGTILYLN